MSKRKRHTRLEMVMIVRMMPREKLEEIVIEAHEVLYPAGDLEHEWEGETVERVAEVLAGHGLGAALKDKAA